MFTFYHTLVYEIENLSIDFPSILNSTENDVG
jgi:hypothetical protein